MTNQPKEGDIIDGKVVTGVYWPWIKFGNVCGSGWVKVDEILSLEAPGSSISQKA